MLARGVLFLMLAVSVNVQAESLTSQAPKESSTGATLKVGDVIHSTDQFDQTSRKTVVEVVGDRALVRYGDGITFWNDSKLPADSPYLSKYTDIQERLTESKKMYRSDSRALGIREGGITMVSHPIANPYESVLVPVYKDKYKKDQIIGYRQEKVTGLVENAAGLRGVTGPSGEYHTIGAEQRLKIYGFVPIGNTILAGVNGAIADTLRGAAIPVKPGQTPEQAITEFKNRMELNADKEHARLSNDPDLKKYGTLKKVQVDWSNVMVDQPVIEQSTSKAPSLAEMRAEADKYKALEVAADARRAERVAQIQREQAENRRLADEAYAAKQAGQKTTVPEVVRAAKVMK